MALFRYSCKIKIIFILKENMCGSYICFGYKSILLSFNSIHINTVEYVTFCIHEDLLTVTCDNFTAERLACHRISINYIISSIGPDNPTVYGG